MRSPLPAALAAASLAALLTACGSSAPARPSWCAPLVAQLHAKQTRQQEISALTALQKSGAPLGQLIADEKVFAGDEAAANEAGTGSFAAAGRAPADLAKVAADLKAVNSQCGQPADAYKTDSI